MCFCLFNYVFLLCVLSLIHRGLSKEQQCVEVNMQHGPKAPLITGRPLNVQIWHDKTKPICVILYLFSSDAMHSTINYSACINEHPLLIRQSVT